MVDSTGLTKRDSSLTGSNIEIGSETSLTKMDSSLTGSIKEMGSETSLTKMGSSLTAVIVLVDSTGASFIVVSASIINNYLLLAIAFEITSSPVSATINVVSFDASSKTGSLTKTGSEITSLTKTGSSTATTCSMGSASKRIGFKSWT